MSSALTTMDTLAMFDGAAYAFGMMKFMNRSNRVFGALKAWSRPRLITTVESPSSPSDLMQRTDSMHNDAARTVIAIFFIIQKLLTHILFRKKHTGSELDGLFIFGTFIKVRFSAEMSTKISSSR